MPSAADDVIQALRAVHDEFAARVADYSDTDLVRPSAASDWTVAQVLSHLGSGAEIARAGLHSTLSGSPAPEKPFYESVWDRWNAMSPREQANGSVASDMALVVGYEALDGGAREAIRFSLPFLPEPVGLDMVGAMRLNESALHAWDIAAADDPTATLNPAAVPVLLRALTGGPMSFMVRRLGKGSSSSAVLAVRISEPDQELTVSIGEHVALQPMASETSDGMLTMPAEAFLRLLTGRLGPNHTPAAVSVTGTLDLPALRAVFPGF